MAEKDEGQLLTEERERAYRERIAELKAEKAPPPPPPPQAAAPKPKAKVKDA